MTRQELITKARDLWRRYRNGGRPTEAERGILLQAYYDNALPKDPDYSVYQWVEDGFPSL